jgi:hypothetical protein
MHQHVSTQTRKEKRKGKDLTFWHQFGESQVLCLAAQDRLPCACMIVASAPAAFAQSCKDVILLGRLLVCAKSVNVHYMHCAYMH